MRIVIRGTVQGVGFRPAVYRAAVRAGASGTVRNDGSAVFIETDRGEELLRELLSDLPPLARVEEVSEEPSDYGGPEGFSIIASSGHGTGASIPADSAVCDRCVAEMLSPGRRRGYPFTTCTDCGPRFTLLKGLPYDRPLTSMGRFPMCPKCGREFSSPGDRRFHHQTIACPSCGPSYRLETPEGVFTDDPVGRLAEILDGGGRAIVKGWGGMHICCTLDRIPELREWYGRRQKPFAVMARDMDALRRYGEPTPEEESLLTSPGRPIVLVRKRDLPETEAASPGLDTVGMFLPYAGMHHLLFSRLSHDALVMTSANPPGEPMAVTDDEARRLDVDAWLLHDQDIVNRADDTVVRLHGDRTQYIRRSRGAVPSYLEIPLAGDAVALGAQENLAGAVASAGRIWPTQYIGNGEKIGVPEYLEEAVRTQMSLVGCSPSAVAVDLHPGYANRRLGKALASEYGAELVEVQHHWAHAASLMVDSGIDGCVAVALDGTGHGDDGTAWGGEVLSADLSGYRRTAHLQPIPLIGGDRALHDIRRLRFAIDAMNGADNRDFSEKEAEVLRKMMPKSVMCSSMGRVLDAIAYSLGVCTERTYDGEPAMKLESLLNRGHLIDGYEARSEGGVVMTAELFDRIDPKDRPEDVAYSMVRGIVTELTELAVQEADASGFEHVGLTGGVSYNGMVSRTFENTVISSIHVPVLHRRVPNGDGGISAGQAAVALHRIQ
ncbi:MAG: carbamoyltransferase HypF [Thermoplasmata archaeon]|nr:carbamoyltransferase HypF [Thermoplasmata archaeon]